MYRGKQRIGGGRRDRKAAHSLAGRRAPSLPQPGQRHQPAIREPDRIRLALLAELLPFIKAIEWNEAAPPGKGFAEGLLRVDALGLGVDVGEADLEVLRPERHQAPTHDIEAVLPSLGIVAANG